MSQEDFPRIPVAVKNRLDARRYAKMGLITVRFGTDPPGPGDYDYEISDADRLIIQQVLDDNQSSDELRRKAALEAWSGALYYAAPGIDAAMLGVPIGELSSLTLDLLGKTVLQPFSFPLDSNAIYYSNGDQSCVITHVSLSGVPGGPKTISMNASWTLLDWECTELDNPFSPGDTMTRYNSEGISAVAHVPAGNLFSLSSTTSWDAAGALQGPLGVCPNPVGTAPAYSQPAQFYQGAQSDSVTVTLGDSVCVTGRLPDGSGGFLDTEPVCLGESMDFNMPELGFPQDQGNTGGPGDMPLTKDQIEALANCLRDPTCSGNWANDYAPNPEDPIGEVPPGDGGGVQLPTDPSGSIDPDSPFPDPCLDDGDPPLVPPDPDDPSGPGGPGGPLSGTPLDDFKFHDGIGKNPLARMKSPLFDDPFNPDFMPGKPFGLDFDGQPRLGKIGRFKPPRLGGFDPGNLGGPGGIGGPSDIGGPGGLGGITGPGGIGDIGGPGGIGDIGGPGGIGDIPSPGPIPDPGEIIGPLPPFPDEQFPENRCYQPGKSLISIAVELATELGIDETKIIIEETCTDGLWPGGCFLQGSEKFDALWRVLAMMGAGIFSDYSGGAIIGCLDPINVHHGPYHEHKNLFIFGPIFDDIDIPRYVIWKKPPSLNDPGSGYEIRVEVVTIYDIPEDKVEIHYAPLGMSAADALVAATAKAASYERQTRLVEFAVPLKLAIRLRHQAQVRQPSKGIDINYMVWEYTHDADYEEGYVTLIKGVELSRTTYVPRFEDFATAWG